MLGLSLVIGNKNYSSWSLRPWLLLRYFDIGFEEIRVALYTDKTHEKLARHSPSLKVPVLKDGSLVIWDSLAICEYISETFLNHQGWPADKVGRAVARSVSAEMHSGFFALRNELPMNCRKQYPEFELTTEARLEVERVKDIWSDCREQFQSEGDWLCGPFSIADCMFAPVVLRFHGYGVTLTGALKAYAERVMALPEMQAWIAAAEQEVEVIDIAEM